MKNKKVQNSPICLVTDVQNDPIVENMEKKKFIFKCIFKILWVLKHILNIYIFFRTIEKNGNFQRISRSPMKNVHAKNQVNKFAISYVALMQHYAKQSISIVLESGSEVTRLFCVCMCMCNGVFGQGAKQHLLPPLKIVSHVLLLAKVACQC